MLMKGEVKMRKFILGTDWWTDCDDAVAIRMLARYMHGGRIDLIGIAVNACMDYSIASIRGFMDKEGIGSIPLGIDLEATDFGGRPPYQEKYALRHSLTYRNEDVEDALRLYRRLLADADEPIEIIEIGYPQVLAALLESGADDLSPLSGAELVAKKVKKLWIMAGKWDADGERENNFCRNARSRIAAEKLCRLWPTDITFLGWEIGYDVLTGGELSDDDHLHHILVDHGSGEGRCSWDPMLVLMALLGDEREAGYSTVTGHATVNPEDGTNYFLRDDNGTHKYVIKDHGNDWYKQRINEIIN